MNTSKKLWFKAKRYGWGWTPTSWEGWVIMLVYIIYLVHVFRVIDAVQHSGSDTLINFAPRFILATLILLAICYTNGEKPRWHWGEKK
jgi:hypothetical protein